MILRWAFNFIAVVAGILCIATITLWIRSYRYFDALSTCNGQTYYGWASAKGTLKCYKDIWPSPYRQVVWDRMWTGWDFRAKRATKQQKGFEEFAGWSTWQGPWGVHRGFHFDSYGQVFNLEVPHWFVALIFGLIASGPLFAKGLQRLPAIRRERRMKVRRTRRVLVISLVTVAVVLPAAALLSGTSLGEAWAAVRDTPVIYLLFIVVPAVGIVLVVVTLQLQRTRLTARKNRFLCAKCGYNLTGNASGVCPECGNQIANALRS
jgi:hypothetical protein